MKVSVFPARLYFLSTSDEAGGEAGGESTGDQDDLQER